MPLKPINKEDLKHNPVHLIYLLSIDPNFEIPMHGSSGQERSSEDNNKSLKALQMVLQSEISASQYQELQNWGMWNGGVKELRELLINPNSMVPQTNASPAQSSKLSFGESFFESHSKQQKLESEARKYLIAEVESRISELSELHSDAFSPTEPIPSATNGIAASENDRRLLSLPPFVQLAIRRYKIEKCDEISKNIEDATLQNLSEEQFKKLEGLTGLDVLNAIEQTQDPIAFLNFDNRQIKAAEDIGMTLSSREISKIEYFYHFADSENDDRCGIAKLLDKDGLTDKDAKVKFDRIAQIAEIFVKTVDQEGITNAEEIAGHSFDDLLKMQEPEFAAVFMEHVNDDSDAEFEQNSEGKNFSREASPSELEAVPSRQASHPEAKAITQKREREGDGAAGGLGGSAKIQRANGNGSGRN